MNLNPHLFAFVKKKIKIKIKIKIRSKQRKPPGKYVICMDGRIAAQITGMPDNRIGQK
jgi:hypothetical protein